MLWQDVFRMLASGINMLAFLELIPLDGKTIKEFILWENIIISHWGKKKLFSSSVSYRNEFYKLPL